MATTLTCSAGTITRLAEADRATTTVTMSCGLTVPYVTAAEVRAAEVHPAECDDCYFEDNRRCLEDATGETWDDDAVSDFLACC